MFCVLLAPVCCYCNCSCVPIVLAVRIILVVLVFLVKRCPDQFPVAKLFLFCITLNLLINCDSYASEAQGGCNLICESYAPEAQGG